LTLNCLGPAYRFPGEQHDAGQKLEEEEEEEEDEPEPDVSILEAYHAFNTCKRWVEKQKDTTIKTMKVINA
jgi:hypothetical protein